MQFAATIQQQSSGIGSAGNNIACVTQGISQTASTSNTNSRPIDGEPGGDPDDRDPAEQRQWQQLGGERRKPDDRDVQQSDPDAISEPDLDRLRYRGHHTEHEPDPNGTTDGNASLDIEQNQDRRRCVKGSATGANSANFNQTTNQKAVANTKAGKNVTQLQNSTDGDGSAGNPFSGIVGTINQDSKGPSSATVTQGEVQCEDAANTSTSAALTGCSHHERRGERHHAEPDAERPGGTLHAPGKEHRSRPLLPQGHRQVAADRRWLRPMPTSSTSPRPRPSTPTRRVATTTVIQSNIMQGDCASSGNGSATGGTCTASQQATLNGTTSGTTSDGYTAG